jgi:hypothetical protein
VCRVGFLFPTMAMQREILGLQEVVVAREVRMLPRIRTFRQAGWWGSEERHGAGHSATLEEGSLV